MLARTQTLFLTISLLILSSISISIAAPVSSSSSSSSSSSIREHLTKRNALQPRDEAADIISLGLAALDAIKEIVADILDIDDAMHAAESSYTQNMYTSLQAQYPTSNIMVCHDPGAYDLVNAVHVHQECDIGLGFTYGYEIYVFDYGTFSNGGDGGYINWAYGGSFTADGSDVTFYSMD